MAALTVVATSAAIICLVVIDIRQYSGIEHEHWVRAETQAQTTRALLEEHSNRLFDYGDGLLRSVRCYSVFRHLDGMADFLRKIYAPHLETFQGTVTITDANGRAVHSGENWAPGSDLSGREYAQGGAAAGIRSLLERGDEAGAAQRLHRSRGAATNLGAMEMAAAAAAVKAAHESGGGPIAPRLYRLEAAMNSAPDGARRYVARVGDEVTGGATGDRQMLKAELERLLALFRSHDLEAIDAFAALRPTMAAVAVDGVTQKLATAVEYLDFATAVGDVTRTLVELY